jgi:hypothetical protein
MTTYPDDPDGEVLAQLAAHGIDMSQPLHIEFAVDAPDDASARVIEQALQAAGYVTELDYDEGEPDEFDPDEEGEFDPDDEEEFGPSWTVYAHLDMVPEYDEIVRIQADLGRIATPLGGKPDGWGALIG